MNLLRFQKTDFCINGMINVVNVLGRTSGRLHARFVFKKRHVENLSGLFWHMDIVSYTSCYGNVPFEWLWTRAVLGAWISLHILVPVRIFVRLAGLSHHKGGFPFNRARYTRRNAQRSRRQEECQKQKEETDYSTVQYWNSHVPGHAEYLRRLLQGSQDFTQFTVA